MSQLRSYEYPLPSGNSAFGISYGQFDLASATELADLTWRVQELEVVVALVNPFGNFPGNGTFSIFTRSLTGDITDIRAFSEYDNVADSSGGVFTYYMSGALDYSSLGVFDFFLVPYHSLVLDLTGDEQTGWHLYAHLEIVDDSPAVPPFYGLYTSPVFLSSPTSSAATLVVNGHGTGLYENTGDDWTGDITVTPVAWWPSAPTAGGADIFDSASGAQISDNVVLG